MERKGCTDTQTFWFYTAVYFYFCNTLLLNYSSSCPTLLPAGRSGIDIIFTTMLVQPVKCCVRCPEPVSGLYCSQANPVAFHSLKTFSTTFFRKFEYNSRACSWWGPAEVAMSLFGGLASFQGYEVKVQLT